MKPVVLSECGHTTCSACLNNYVLKEGKCFVCTKPCREKDVIRVAESATGYAGHGEKLEASKHTPTAWL
jgi:nitric oxide synthase-interacting protein